MTKQQRVCFHTRVVPYTFLPKKQRVSPFPKNRKPPPPTVSAGERHRGRILLKATECPEGTRGVAAGHLPPAPVRAAPSGSARESGPGCGRTTLMTGCVLSSPALPPPRADPQVGGCRFGRGTFRSRLGCGQSFFHHRLPENRCKRGRCAFSRYPGQAPKLGVFSVYIT